MEHVAEPAERNPVFLARSCVPAWAAFAYVACFAVLPCVLDVADVDVTGSLGLAWWVGLGIVALAAVPQRAEVGAEGLRLTWLGPSRLVRYQEIARAAPFGREDVVLVYDGCRELHLRKRPLGEESPRAVLASIWETLVAGAEAGARPNERALLARGARDVRTWTRDLRALVAGGAEYRSGLGDERLDALVANPAVRAELRGAAAVALSSARTDRARLRVLARRTVEPGLRSALTRISDATSEDDLVGALTDLVTAQRGATAGPARG
jgi:hypothetical protein